MPAPLVSVFIPTYNGAATLPQVLAALRNQKTDFPYEIVAIDSSSRDTTREILAEHQVRFETIPSTQFNHGATRNAGVALCHSEFVALMTQDALPADDQFLQRLAEPLRRDPRIAGATARQKPVASSTLLPKIDLHLWVAGSAVSSVRFRSHIVGYEQMSPMERRTLCNFDDIAGLIRKSVWQQHPYAPLNFAEDLQWGKTVFEAGYGLAHAAEAVVYHSHDRSFRYEFKRAFVTSEIHDRLFAIDDAVPLPRALGMGVLAPWNLARVYPPAANEPPAAIARAAWIVLARGLGRWWYGQYRPLKHSQPGIAEQIRRACSSGV
ncbi:MAG TPA: glycosyltransferase family 2 protein [Planctomycetota bacterium]|nr:glycosyltransferase family 2 protein [Planctomycetota bacterium]